ncbi:MAG: phosphatase PAP2 family protein [Algiphilus sp.]|uniref:phosphatase PAP2 family protein n=1 Tax=Algiphilus sp. TaxID=1872431 RepID=UPI0025BE5A9D|nr:phosphatase PAP2 family protein [Algiphilus sp.]MCI5103719.1 phosphatase PAP2 family protein [Algiphilus sp.]
MPLSSDTPSVPSPAPAQLARTWRLGLTPQLREHALLALVLSVHTMVAYALAAYHGLHGAIHISLYGEHLMVMLLAAGTAFVTMWLLRIVFVLRPAQPLAFALNASRRFQWKRRLTAALPSLLLLAVLISVYSSWKVMMPAIAPFSWDQRFHLWDLALHGGKAPWEWLHPLLGQPLVTSLINAGYHLWLFVIYFVFLWQAFALTRPVLRTQFMLCFVLLWTLLGNGLATWLSSAGPCYYGLIVGPPDPYGPLLDYLRSAQGVVPIWALDVQQLLWNDYQSGALAVGRGISAMPSLHVATTTLIFLLACRYGRPAGWAAGIFLGLILIGSVHLAWHYAIDGYLSLVLTLIIWRLSGAVSRRLHRNTLCRESASESGTPVLCRL